MMTKVLAVLLTLIYTNCWAVTYTATEYCTDGTNAAKAIGSRIRRAQVFTLDAQSTIYGTALQMGTDTGTVTSSMICRIETLSSGAPSGTLANANATVTLTSAQVGENVWQDFIFASSFTLNSGSYAVVFQMDPESDSFNYNHYGDASGYTGGDTYYSVLTPPDTWGTWTLQADTDINFKIYDGIAARERIILIQ